MSAGMGERRGQKKHVRGNDKKLSETVCAVADKQTTQSISGEPKRAGEKGKGRLGVGVRHMVG
jgi:hypothetical protein